MYDCTVTENRVSGVYVEEQTVERSEQSVESLTRIADYCRSQNVDPAPILPATEGLVDAVANMPTYARRVVGEAIKEGLR
jgi:hypothetical protein